MDNEQLIATLNSMNDNTQKLTRVIDDLAKSTAFDQPKSKTKTETKEQIKASLNQIDKATELFFESALATEKQGEIAKETSKSLEDFQAAVEINGGAFKQMNKAQREALMEYGTLGQNVATFAANVPTDALESYNTKLSKKLGVVGKTLGPLSKKSMIAAAGLGTLAVTIGAVVGRLAATIEISGDLAKSGVVFNQNIGQIAGTAASLNMSLEEFAGLASTNARTFNLAGGRLVKETGRASSELRSLGLTTSESAEFLVGYAERQRRLGLTEFIGTQRQTMAASSLLSATNELSSTFGTSVDEIQDSLSKAYDNPMVRSAIMSLPKNLQQGVQETFDKQLAFMSASSPQMADMFTDIFSASAPQLSESFQQAVQAGTPGIANAMANFANQVKSGNLSEAQAEEERMRMLKTVAGANVDMLRVQASAGNSAASAMLEQVLAAREAVKQQEEFNKLSPQERQARLEQAQSQRQSAARLREFSESIKNLGTKIIGGFLQGLGENTDDMAKVFSSLAEKGASFAKQLGQMTASFAEFLTNWGGVVAAGVAIGSVAMLLKKTALGKNIKAGIVNVYGKIAGAGGKTGVAGKAGAGGKAKGLLGGARGMINRVPGLFVLTGAIGGVMGAFEEFDKEMEKSESIAQSLVAGVTGASKGLFKGIAGGVTSIVDMLFGTNLTTLINESIDKLYNYFNNLGSSLGGAIFDLFNSDSSQPPSGQRRRNQRRALFDQETNETSSETINTTNTRRRLKQEKEMERKKERELLERQVAAMEEQNRLTAIQTKEIKRAGNGL